jgi:hypothetical protein
MIGAMVGDEHEGSVSGLGHGSTGLFLRHWGSGADSAWRSIALSRWADFLCAHGDDPPQAGDGHLPPSLTILMASGVDRIQEIHSPALVRPSGRLGAKSTVDYGFP